MSSFIYSWVNYIDLIKPHHSWYTLYCILKQWKKYITRLLGRPQPQMYPPVALNQYTWVNRTHKHYIYIYFKAPWTFWNNQTGPSWFTSTLSFIYIYLSNMEGSNLISIFWIKIQNTVKLEYIKVQGTWVNTLICTKFDATESVYECLFHKWVTIIVCHNTLTMVSIIYINLNHLYSIIFLLWPCLLVWYCN